MFSRGRGKARYNTLNVKATNETARARVFGRFGKVQRKHTGAAALVSACFALGVYTAGADGNDPAAKFTDSLNDVLFVGVAGALINNAPLKSALVDDVSTENAFVNTGATSVPADILVNLGDQAAE